MSTEPRWVVVKADALGRAWCIHDTHSGPPNTNDPVTNNKTIAEDICDTLNIMDGIRHRYQRSTQEARP